MLENKGPVAIPSSQGPKQERELAQSSDIVAHPRHLYIDGEWVRSAGDVTIDVISAHSEERLTTVAAANGEDVKRAAASARGVRRRRLDDHGSRRTSELCARPFASA